MDSVSGGRHYAFPLDGAHAHNSKGTHDWCLACLLEAWPTGNRPPKGPDCNPLAYHVWSVCGQNVCKAPHNTGASLMAKVLEAMGNLPRDTVAKACGRFPKRIEAVVKSRVNFFK